jgi:hypothetical protein
VTILLLVNVALFLPAALVGVGMCAFGWMLAGHGADGGGPGDDGGFRVVDPIEPLPVTPLATIERRDLARSA